VTYCTVFVTETVKGWEWYYAPREQKGSGSPPTKCFIMYVLRLYCNNKLIILSVYIMFLDNDIVLDVHQKTLKNHGCFYYGIAWYYTTVIVSY